jgi:hypothetical protein
MSRERARDYRYPFIDNLDLARVMQYATMQLGDPVYLKEKVSQFLLSVNAPDFRDPSEPHALLAGFPISVFLTTNYDDFLFKALRWVGKNPNLTMCSWSAGADYDKYFFETPAGLRPGIDEPLVYHLHGSAHTPRSLVLTENDYLEFLVQITGSQVSTDSNIIPSSILSALTNNPLLFIGYSLQDWTFRVIFHGLLRPIPDTHRRRSVSVQLTPPINGSLAEAEVRARHYMEHYLGHWNIAIFWGTAAEFCRELQRRTGSTP